MRHLSKPWVILLITFFVVVAAVAFSINDIMKALLHTRPAVVVPSLEGKSLANALAIVSQLNLSLKQEGTEFDESLPAGTILRQQPPTGMQIRTERSINVVISKGGQSVFVPGVAGRKLAEAQSVLAAEGLQMGAVNDVFSTTYEENFVVSQSPSSGTIVARGALIDVEVSKGLPPVGAPLVPDFIGQNLENVREWARGVNAQVNTKEDAKAVGVPGTVTKQKPSAGQPLQAGDEVMVTVVPLLGSERGNRLSYKIPAGNSRVTLKIIGRDNRGEAEIYNGKHKGGETVEIPVNVNATTRVRIYVDDLLQEERVLEP